jgi:hypothetical protein
LPVGVEPDVRTVNDCDDPALTISGPAGLVAALAGRPVIATETLPLKPLEDSTVTVTDPVVAPMLVASDDGDADKEKSGCGGGEDDPPPPQAELSAHNHA